MLQFKHIIIQQLVFYTIKFKTENFFYSGENFICWR